MCKKFLTFFLVFFLFSNYVYSQNEIENAESNITGEWEHYSIGDKLIMLYGKRTILSFNSNKTFLFKIATYGRTPDDDYRAANSYSKIINGEKWKIKKIDNKFYVYFLMGSGNTYYPFEVVGFGKNIFGNIVLQIKDRGNILGYGRQIVHVFFKK